MVEYLVGVDVGSTTVKAVVVHAASGTTVWQDYQRHETRQPEKVLEFLKRIEVSPGITPSNARIFFTGSGGGNIASLTGGKFVQEVHAVALAVEKLHPEVYSVIELGGQDAKIIVFQDDPAPGRKKKIASMNDKCAGGTGAVLDKINAKLCIPAEDMAKLPYKGIKLHPVAGKCGVFAETDINGLQKAGTPPIELMASLFDAIVLQNLSVLTRGNTLLPHVLLLGGPNTFLKGMQEAWQANIPRMWKDRNVVLPEGIAAEDLIKTPANAQFYAALGLVEYAKTEAEDVGIYAGRAALIQYLDHGRAAEKAQSGARGLASSPADLESFLDEYRPKPFKPGRIPPGERVRAILGLDAGSTSTKAVLTRTDGELLVKSYRLSGGNPIEDTIDVLDQLRKQVEDQGAALEIVGVGTTGYAKDMLKEVLHADVALVETVAHTLSAMHLYEDPHVIVDVGGQDIKLIFVHQGRVKDFKLNTQCSAGNGYFLQATAEGFGVPATKFAEVAFTAKSMPEFGYGCAVFLQGDIVNFQRQGWRAEEILAALAAVLPKNVFLYVAGVPNLPAYGTRFVLQGGTQKNLAVVKAEVDFLRSCFRGSGKQPEIMVHEHCGESGAIGAALEAARMYRRGHRTSFIGLDAVRKIHYNTTRNEDTRCNYCKNNCLRTFLDVSADEIPTQHAHVFAFPVLASKPEPLVSILAAPGARTAVEMPKPAQPSRTESKVPLAQGAQRLILATCEKGTVEDLDKMRVIKQGMDQVKTANPNLMEVAAKRAFQQVDVRIVADPVPSARRLFQSASARQRIEAASRRSGFRIGIPRVLNAYTYAPLFQGYFQGLGIPAANIVYSAETSAELYRAGSGRGAVDPCFPSKVALSHVHDLLATQHARKPLNAIWFPMYDTLRTKLTHLTGSCACPTVTATPEAAKAAFTKERDLFAEHGIAYVNPILNLDQEPLMADQLFRAWAPLLGLSRAENDRAVQVGLETLAAFESGIQRQARTLLDRLERDGRMGIVMLGRPYHHDPGLNHGILEEFQRLCYPIFSQCTLPMDEDLLDRLFGEDVRNGFIAGPLDISDVWKNRYSASTNHKIWAAKFAARHPNLAAIELSSFKCGHDAPIYNVIERILEYSGTPFFAFKDLDENKPSGSLRIRVETVDHFLRLHRERFLTMSPPSHSDAPLCEDYPQALVGAEH
jgi:activator of 2-hydroxyglutaryl-CoA dehydratase/predicted nucleotide-binding protein (sugar kinase/HSP70/actin superfamily)